MINLELPPLPPNPSEEELLAYVRKLTREIDELSKIFSQPVQVLPPITPAPRPPTNPLAISAERMARKN